MENGVQMAIAPFVVQAWNEVVGLTGSLYFSANVHSEGPTQTLSELICHQSTSVSALVSLPHIHPHPLSNLAHFLLNYYSFVVFQTEKARVSDAETM